MSTLRKAEIQGMLARWLERYSPPSQIRDNNRAQQDEVESLLGVLLKFAPGSDYTGFINRVFDQLEYQMKTRAWPTKGEVGAVCSNLRKEMPKAEQTSLDTDMSDAGIFARQMARGESVPVGALYGIVACEMIARGLVDEATMRAYRSNWFFARQRVYDEDRARRDEAEQIAKHDAAKEVWRQRNDEKPRRDVHVPDKSAPIPEGFAA